MKSSKAKAKASQNICFYKNIFQSSEYFLKYLFSNIYHFLWLFRLYSFKSTR